MHDAVGRAVLAALALLTSMTANTVASQGTARASVGDYPTKPVRMIVPLAPGGGSDIVGRMVALELFNHWGQSVVVDNRPGSGSTVGTSIVAKAPADGYTVLVSSSSIAISPALYKNLDFDIKRDLAGVTLIASQPSILAVHSSVPASSVKELIAFARAHPGKLAYASAGPGSATHLGTELLKYTAAIDLLHIPYKSAGQATSALLSGETQILLTNMASVLPHVRSGRIKALGVSGLKRTPLAPDLPTVAEAGVPGFEYATWYGMFVPAGTPRFIIKRLEADVAYIINTPQLRERFAMQGLDIYGTSPAEFETFMNNEIAKWSRVVQAAGVRVE